MKISTLERYNARRRARLWKIIAIVVVIAGVVAVATWKSIETEKKIQEIREEYRK